MTNNDENNDAAAAASPVADAAVAPAGLDDFTMDIDKVTAGEVSSEAGKSAGDGEAPTADDDGTAAATGTDDDGEEQTLSGGTEDGAMDTAANDADDAVEESDGEKEAAVTDKKEVASPKADAVTAGDLAAEEATESDSNENEDNGGSDDEEQDELWELKMVLKPSQILQSGAMQCATDGCDLVACCIWSSNLDPETPWYSCLDCQANDFEGWPQNKKEIPIKVLSDELREAMLEKCTRLAEPDLPDLPSGTGTNAAAKSKDEASTTEEDKSSDDAGSSEENESPSNDEEEGEAWDLTKIFTVKELTKKKPIMCSYGKEGECDLVACSKWESKGEDPWYCCLDCQESDYGGWPEEKKELPIDFLTEENRQLIAEKCSAREDPPMPNLPTAMPLLSTTADADDKKDKPFSAITPPPGHDRAVAENQSNIVVGAARGKGGKKKKGGVTPSPMPPKGASKNAAAGAAKKPAEKPKVVSKKSLEMHARWQAEATKLGGPDNKIVLAKPEAKKLIFDKLHDEFCPMNINGLYLKLKAAVPSQLLKSCLDEMLPARSNPFADDSDDDEEDGGKSSKKKGAAKKSEASSEPVEEYANSLRLKEGRNVNNNLYYVDHTKLANEGNGLRPDLRNDLLCNSQKAKAEFDQLTQQLKSITTEATRLESEPKNEELILEVADLEKKMTEVNESVEDARAHAANEKHVKQVKKSIDNMGAVWRKRKRQCMEFISMMEESTEGTISVKKCLKGDGPIDIDSDEMALKGAMAFASRQLKKAKVSRGSLGGMKGSTDGERGGVRPDENFVGVTLNSQGKPERVFMSEE